MRIAMISVHECPLASSEGKERGGLNVYVFELAKALSRTGVAVDMFTRMQDTVNPAVVRVNDLARVIHIPAGPKTPVPKQNVLYHLPEFARNMAGFIKKEGSDYDIFHAHYYYSGIVARAVTEALSSLAPLVMTFHTLGLMKQLMTTGVRADDPPERIMLEKTLMNDATKIVSTSENDTFYVQSLYDVLAGRTATVPPGVDTAIFYNQPKETSKHRIGATPAHRIILSVGRINPIKGFDVLLYALKILKHKVWVRSFFRLLLRPC